ncbi:MAG: NADH-quinone oxidoreductase subunit H [Candidatus Aureabacteria bacterium]|nr:NADH-quinone oxidoreductase subunit H [Candidatus Auribacterota bacterium]
MKLLCSYSIYLGMVCITILGMMASWVDRKITAKLQWRVGPPWYQSFADFLKLWGKETTIPEGCSRLLFPVAPVIGVAGAACAAALLAAAAVDPSADVRGSLILTLCFLAAPAVALIIGGAASHNELASLGARRELRLAVACEVPFLIAVFTPALRAGGALRLGEMVAYQRMYGMILPGFSGIISFLVTLICMLALLRFTPFDCAEADTEINSGPLILYSGKMLGLLKLMKMMMLGVVPLFLITLFMGGIRVRWPGIAITAIQYLLLVLLATVLRNTNPRARIDQAERFFLIPMTIAACAGAVLAVIGY